MKALLFFFALFTVARAELRVPAFTAYTDPDVNQPRISSTNGITRWTDPAQRVSWFGEIKSAGKLTAAVALKLPKNAEAKWKLTVGKEAHEGKALGTGEAQTVTFGEFSAEAGYVHFELTSLNPKGTPSGDLEALLLDGPATVGAHFNLQPRRNAASVHLFYPTPKDAQIESFYNEATAVQDPVATFYMTAGFSRGYFGMQVNSATERRIIFSVWDAGSGQSAANRSTVAPEDQVQLLAKGEGVEAGVFGNEGTGGHSHLLYNWKTGEAQKFVLTAKAHDATHTDYSGYWFHPEKKQWMLIASFRAPKDGKLLRGLHSFSENFGGSNGHLRRECLYGPQWIRTTDGKWQELTKATFSHDGTGKTDRLDRMMGVKDGKFFLAQGGFVPGSTKYGEAFDRPATGKAPGIALPAVAEKP
jgi:hypothetical protein